MAPTNKTAVSLFHKNFYMECSICQNVLTEIRGETRDYVAYVTIEMSLFAVCRAENVE